MQTDHRLERLRDLWAQDRRAILAGTYIAPLPPRHMVVSLDRPNNRPPPNKATLAVIERDRAIAAAYLRGDKIAVIATTHGVHPGRVNKVARMRGLPRRRAAQ